MERLITIQKRENLNDVYAVDEKGNGGANHEYLISIDRGLQVPIEVKIQMQNGARKDENATNGVIDSDLLEIVRHRLQCFQAGPFATEYNAKALEHLEIALMYMNRRVEDRIERNVLGTYNK
ncbi:ABC transporter ATPase [Paraclostridium bifermentans]|uniref:ABC transporter ATPase n=1 Tax=Paraclostridium bifermentans TaxID=1490 RepID=UPI00115776DB|nr:ABC transporter ATPase [Paraclostridium bifermentans]TQO59350.1 ABC transporter ATPase [Paraclostridium bifermentans]